MSDGSGSRNRMTIWRDRARADGLRSVEVWVPSGCEADIRAVAQEMRAQAGQLLLQEVRAVRRIEAALEGMQEPTAVALISKVTGRLRTGTCGDGPHENGPAALRNSATSPAKKEAKSDAR